LGGESLPNYARGLNLLKISNFSGISNGDNPLVGILFSFPKVAKVVEKIIDRSIFAKLFL